MDHPEVSVKEVRKESEMTNARQSNSVRVHYKGTLSDGTVFDSSEGCDPLAFTMAGKDLTFEIQLMEIS